jgi:hypothetical protein
LIHRNVAESLELTNALNPSTIPLYYDDCDTYVSLSALIQSRFPDKRFAHVAWFNHGAPDQLILTSQIQLSSSSTLSPEGESFWQLLGSKVKPTGSIDLLGCSIAATPQGKTLLQRIETLTHRKVAASTNPTGSKNGMDWLLETENVDAQQRYFLKERLSQWSGTLAAPTIPSSLPYFDGVSTGILISPLSQNYTENATLLSFDLKLTKPLNVGSATDATGNTIEEWQTLFEFSHGKDFLNTTIEFSSVTGVVRIRQGTLENPSYLASAVVTGAIANDTTSATIALNLSTNQVSLNGGAGINLVTAGAFNSIPGSYPYLTLGYSYSNTARSHFHGKIATFTLTSAGSSYIYRCSDSGSFSGPTQTSSLSSTPVIAYGDELFKQPDGYDPALQRLFYNLYHLRSVLLSNPNFYAELPDGTTRLVSSSYPSDEEYTIAAYLIGELSSIKANLPFASAAPTTGLGYLASQIVAGIPAFTGTAGTFDADLQLLQPLFRHEEGKSYSSATQEMLDLIEEVPIYLTNSNITSTSQLEAIRGSMIRSILPKAINTIFTRLEDRLGELSDQLGLCSRAVKALNSLQKVRLDPKIKTNERNEISTTLMCANTPTLQGIGDQWCFNGNIASRIHFGLYAAVLKYVDDYQPDTNSPLPSHYAMGYSQFQNITGHLLLAQVPYISNIAQELQDLYYSETFSSQVKESFASVLGLPSSTSFNRYTFPPRVGLLDALDGWNNSTNLSSWAPASPATTGGYSSDQFFPEIFLFTPNIDSQTPALSNTNAPQFTTEIDFIETNLSGIANTGTNTQTYSVGSTTAPTSTLVFANPYLRKPSYDPTLSAGATNNPDSRVEKYFTKGYWLFKWYENLENSTSITTALSSIQSVNETTSQEIQIHLTDYLSILEQLFAFLKKLRQIVTQIVAGYN